MGWSFPFLEAISQPVFTPQLLLRSWKVLDHPTGLLFTGFQALASTHHLEGPTARIVDVSVVGDSIDPGSWASQLGEWYVVVATDDYEATLTSMVRGDLCELLCGRAGWPEADMQTVELGILWNIERMTDGLYRLRIRGASSVLQSRYTTTSENLRLFANPGTATTAAAWTHGGGDLTFEVDDVSGLRSETGGNGMIKVTPVGEGNDPFYLEYSSTDAAPSPDEITLTTGNGALASTATSLTGSNDTVDEVAYIADHPLTAIAKVLASTGNGTNGPYDTLPATWGMGIPERLIDRADILYWVGESSPASGSSNWHVYSDGAQANPLEWVQGVLQPAGMYLAWRQGAYTLRAAVPVADRFTLNAEIIEARDVFAYEHREFYEAIAPVGYKSVRATGPSSSSDLNEDVQTLPAERRALLDLSAYVHLNESAWLLEIAERIGPWLTRSPERLELRCRLRLAHLAIGDVVELHIGGQGRLAQYDHRRALVTSISRDWLRGEVLLTVHVQPRRGEL